MCRGGEPRNPLQRCVIGGGSDSIDPAACRRGRFLPEPKIASGLTVVLSMLMVCVCGLVGEGSANIYTWVDRDGQVHFTDDYAVVPPEYRDRVQSRPSSPP